MPTAEKTELSEYVRPPASVWVPAYLLSKLLTTNFSLPLVPGTVKIRLRDGHSELVLVRLVVDHLVAEHDQIRRLIE